MPRYAVKNAGGVQVYEYVADRKLLDMEAFPSPPYTHDEIPEPQEPPPPPVYGGRRILTRLEFLRLLKQQERVQIRGFSKGNNQFAPVIEDFMFLLEMAQEVNLDDEDLIAGVNQLEAGGMLNTGRAAEILNG